mmetsp:Transcript_35065/g.110826  ORF Transcript_35065/g.110826 Transcript_35065/m.110826 type:complete len:218 (+) Transcript_35065:173-826(+)
MGPPDGSCNARTAASRRLDACRSGWHPCRERHMPLFPCLALEGSRIRVSGVLRVSGPHRSWDDGHDTKLVTPRMSVSQEAASAVKRFMQPTRTAGAKTVETATGSIAKRMHEGQPVDEELVRPGTASRRKELMGSKIFDSSPAKSAAPLSPLNSSRRARHNELRGSGIFESMPTAISSPPRPMSASKKREMSSNIWNVERPPSASAHGRNSSQISFG